MTLFIFQDLPRPRDSRTSRSGNVTLRLAVWGDTGPRCYTDSSKQRQQNKHMLQRYTYIPDSLDTIFDFFTSHPSAFSRVKRSLLLLQTSMSEAHKNHNDGGDDEYADVPFELTELDRTILKQTDEEFTYHDWEDIKNIVGRIYPLRATPAFVVVR